MKPIEATLTLRNNRLKKLRIERNLSQREMAALIGVSLPYYSSAECLRPTYPTVIKKICDFFELEESYLFPEEIRNLKTKIVQEISKEDFAIDYKNHLMIEQSNKQDKERLDGISETVFETLETLTSREKEIIKKRFGIETDPHTLEKLSKQYGVGKERIRQIEARAIRKLRHPSRSTELKKFV